MGYVGMGFLTERDYRQSSWCGDEGLTGLGKKIRKQRGNLKKTALKEKLWELRNTTGWEQNKNKKQGQTSRIPQPKEGRTRNTSFYFDFCKFGEIFSDIPYL